MTCLISSRGQHKDWNVSLSSFLKNNLISLNDSLQGENSCFLNFLHEMFITYSVSALHNSGANSQGFASHLTPPIKNNIRTVLDHHIEKMIYCPCNCTKLDYNKMVLLSCKKTCTTGWLNDKKNTPRDICSHSDTCNNAQHVYIDPLLPLILTFNRTSSNSTFTYLRCYCQVTKRIPNKNICPCKR